MATFAIINYRRLHVSNKLKMDPTMLNTSSPIDSMTQIAAMLPTWMIIVVAVGVFGSFIIPFFRAFTRGLDYDSSKEQINTLSRKALKQREEFIEETLAHAPKEGFWEQRRKLKMWHNKYEDKQVSWDNIPPKYQALLLKKHYR